MNTRCGRLACGGLLLVLLALGCSKGGRNAKGAPPPPTVPVTVATAMRQDVPVSVRAIGKVEPLRTVAVRSRVGGQLLRVHFHGGDDVREGQVLFTIDPRPYQVALQQAIANLARDRAHAASARAEVARYGDLIAKEYVTKQDFDNVRANAEALTATEQADSAAVAAARLDLQYSTITAPIAGRTGDLLVREGNLVKANDDQALVVINQVAPIAVSFSIPQQRLADIRRYAAAGPLVVHAAVGADTTQASSLQGQLSFIDNAVDPSTGTILLKAYFPNEDKQLWPGQFATVSVGLTVRRGAVVVPSGALQTGQAGDYVFVVGPDQTVAMRPVRVGPRLADRAAIDSGVEAGEVVVTDGQLRLSPGAKVSIKNGPGAAQGTPSAGGAGAPSGQGQGTTSRGMPR